LVEHLAVASHLRPGTAGEEGAGFNSEESASTVVKHLFRIRDQWRRVLQQSVYER
jgi:hypothetical protein